MTKEQFEDIKKKAWAWYRGNMLEWSIKTLKDIPNAPDWVKRMFEGKSFEASLDKQEFIENYNDDIEAVLIASHYKCLVFLMTKHLMSLMSAWMEKELK